MKNATPQTVSEGADSGSAVNVIESCCCEFARSKVVCGLMMGAKQIGSRVIGCKGGDEALSRLPDMLHVQ
jgi:hypothetical protein